MASRITSNPADYIAPLNINKLEGRMLYIPAPQNKKREILIISGHHGLLERWWSLAENFADFGSVTVPDLPGFGGMDSFEKIGKKINLDSYADYLAAFIKLRFRRKKITIVGISFGFAVVTRMFQKYPELTKKTDLLISLAGFMHKDDFIYSKPQRVTYSFLCRLLGTKVMCLTQDLFFINYPVIKFIYDRAPNSKQRKYTLSKQENQAMVELEAMLWQVNDLRSNWLTISEFLKIDNCQQRIDLDVIHVVAKVDHYLRNEIVTEHMQVVYKGYKSYIYKGNSHTSSTIADKKEAGKMLPPALRKRLNTAPSV